MPNIVINEISQNYTYNVGTNTFATVAIPITASWGPALTQTDIQTSGVAYNDTSTDIMKKLDSVEWNHFPSTQAGMEAFVKAYRCPASNYKSAKDYSYQMAMTYLAAGYDVLVCRVASGAEAQGSASITGTSGFSIYLKAKYQGSFGNNLVVALKSVPLKLVSTTQYYYYNAIVYVKDPTTGSMTAVENLLFVFDPADETDSIPYYEDINSNFITIVPNSGTPNDVGTVSANVTLANGKDFFDADTSTGGAATMMGTGANVGATYFANLRYSLARIIVGDSALDISDIATHTVDFPIYIQKIYGMSITPESGTSYVPDTTTANILRCNEFNYTAAFLAYTSLMDKLNYDPQRIAAPGWDDQNFDVLNFDRNGWSGRITVVSPLHRKIMEVSYYSRCACGMLDIPKSCPRKYVWDTTADALGYAQLLSAERLGATYLDADSTLYPTHVALFAPWGKYRYIGMGKQFTAPPSFLAMLIQRAMILNQPIQYEWALPTNRTHTLKIGEMDYKTPKHILDTWQGENGVLVNAITEIPGMGVTVWGNATLFDIPPATYNALENLSTRYLVDAVKDIVYKCGLAITFQYNNNQAYSTFYAGVTPTLDTMKNVGAIEDYYVHMAADINGLDQVNANSVIGKVYLVINGAISNITVDLIALPPGTDLNQFAAQ